MDNDTIKAVKKLNERVAELELTVLALRNYVHERLLVPSCCFNGKGNWSCMHRGHTKNQEEIRGGVCTPEDCPILHQIT